MSEISDNLKQKISEIPGEDGFWKSSTREDYRLHRDFTIWEWTMTRSRRSYAAARCFGG